MQKKASALSGLAALILLAVAVFLIKDVVGHTDAVIPFVGVAAIGLSVQLLVMWLQQDVCSYGWLTPSIFVAYLAAASEWWTGSGLAPLGFALLAPVPALGIRFIGNFAQALDALAINLLRVAVVAGPYVGVQFALAQVSGRQAIGFVVSVAFCYFLEKVLVDKAMQSSDDEESVNSWNYLLQRQSAYLPAFLAIGVLCAGYGSTLATHVNPNAAPIIAALIGIIPSLGFNVALWNGTQELVAQDRKQIQMELKKSQHKQKEIETRLTTAEDKAEKKSQELEMVYDMASSLGASTKLSETTQVLMSMIRRLRIPSQSCVLYLSRVNPSTGATVLQAVVAETPYKEILGMENLLQLQEPVILQALQEQRAILIPEVVTSSSQRIFKDEKSVICVPLVVSKENVGVIYLGATKEDTHNQEHLVKLKMLAAYAAPSIKTAMLFEHKDKELGWERDTRLGVEAKNQQMLQLQRLGQAIGASLKIEHTLNVVADSLREMLPEAQSVIIFVTKPNEPHVLSAEVAKSPYEDYVKSLPVRDDEGFIGNAMRANDTQLVQDTQVYEVQNILAKERSVIVAPLTSESESLGCIYVGAKNEHTFNEDHHSLVKTVSYQSAIALKNGRLYEQTQQLALTDGLTGLWTHRYFQERLQDEINWSDRSGKPICLVMVDTDKFKLYNDTLGHPAGDSLLKEIAELLKDKVRASDVVCRYGGDEFSLILKDATKDLAAVTCERIRETFQLRFATAAVQVTASIGVACYPIDAKDKKDLSLAADFAMYVSKKTGRNKVTLSKDRKGRAEEPPEEMVALER